LLDEHGRLSLLDDPEIIEVAAKYGNPDSVLAPVSHAGHGSGAVW